MAKATKKTATKKTTKAKKTVKKTTTAKKKTAKKATPAKKTAKKTVKKTTTAKKTVKKATKAKKTVKKTTKKAAPAKKTAKKTVKKATTTKKATPAKKKAVMSKQTPAKLKKAAKKPAKAATKKKDNVTVLPVAEKKPVKLDFSAGDFVVYPAHGVGQVESVETQTIAGMDMTLYNVAFEKDRMRVKIPVGKAKSSGLRKLSSKDRLKDALSTLQGRSQVRRIMWSRRAQEYETKINSGDPVSIAEVLRDLKKEEEHAEQSYSERQIYQAALARLAREVAAIEEIDETSAVEKLESVLSKVA